MTINRAFFFDHLHDTIFANGMTQAQVDGHEMILDAWEKDHANDDDRWLAYMLATACHETGRKMRPIEENLNYSAKRLLEVFPNRFTPATANSYAHQPEKIANKVYADRIGNGNEASGDGWKYRGRGLPQLTGRANYKKFADLMKIDLVGNPDLALRDQGAVEIMFYGMIHAGFTRYKLADFFHGTTADWINARKTVNGTDVAKNVAVLGKTYYAAIGYTTG
jgi:putative chitinase